MIRINQIKLPIGHSEEELVNKISKLLKINKTSFTYKIAKKSIDARKKPQLFYVYNIDVHCNNEGDIIKKCRDKNVISIKEKKYVMPDFGDVELKKRPIIVGAGPAGLFTAFVLTEAGHCPILFERGKQVEDQQVLHYLMVTEFDYVVLKAQLKSQFGDEEVYLQTRHYRIERSEVQEDIDYLINAEKKFWQQVQERKQPNMILPDINI